MGEDMGLVEFGWSACWMIPLLLRRLGGLLIWNGTSLGTCCPGNLYRKGRCKSGIVNLLPSQVYPSVLHMNAV